jgi:hypothetical protein
MMEKTLTFFNSPYRKYTHFSIDSLSITKTPSFGDTIHFFIPPHGDFNCPCIGCSKYRISIGIQPPTIKIILPPILPKQT